MQRYDETSARVRLSYSLQETAEPSTAKLFVIESQWCLLVKIVGADAEALPETLRYVFIHGAWGRSLRAADNTSAPAIAGVLKSTPHPDSEDVHLFRHRIRLSESDEAPANLKAERLYRQACEADQFTQLGWLCTCHKIHSCAEKTWGLLPGALSGMASALLAIQTSQQVSRLWEALEALVRSKCKVIRGGRLSPSAISYRRCILDLYAPSRSRFPRKRAIVMTAARMFNGNWRNTVEIEHHCLDRECCRNHEETCDKMVYVLKQLVRTMRPNKLG